MKRIILGFASLLIAGIAVAYYLDARIPRATAILQVHPSTIMSSTSGMMMQGYMESEFETITSPETLANAAETLNLTSEETASLREKVTTEPMPGTDFIKITVKHEDADRAIKIANAVAEAYVQRRAKTEESRAARALEVLDNELVAQDELVQKYLQEFRTAAETNSVKVSSSSFGPATFELQTEEPNDPVEVSLRMSRVTQAKEDYEQAGALLHEMKIKQQEARVLLKMPREPVTIHERAKLLIK